MKLKIAFQMDPISDVTLTEILHLDWQRKAKKGVIRYTILILKA